MRPQKKVARLYHTPEATFQTWKEAARQLDFEALISCYTGESQFAMRQQIASTTSDELDKMRREARDTEFKIEKVIYEGNKAYLRVVRRVDGVDDIEVVTMIKEGGQWRLIPIKD